MFKVHKGLFLWQSHGVDARNCDHRRQGCAVFLATDDGYARAALSRCVSKQVLPPRPARRELLGPWAHQCRGSGVACVALERIALQEGSSATDTDRLLGDRDDRALHGEPLSKSAALINMIAMISE
jgi:hypothetical protein